VRPGLGKGGENELNNKKIPGEPTALPLLMGYAGLRRVDNPNLFHQMEGVNGST
jgi:hypothetical protein